MLKGVFYWIICLLGVSAGGWYKAMWYDATPNVVSLVDLEAGNDRKLVL